MSTRLPFQAMSGCPTMDFDINIVPPGFLLCTQPPITVVPVVPLTLVIDMNAPPPPFCPCLPTLNGSAVPTVILENTKKPYMDLTMWNATADCCEPMLTMKMELGIPCMPLEITGTATAIIRVPGRKEWVGPPKMPNVDDIIGSYRPLPWVEPPQTAYAFAVAPEDDITLKVDFTKRPGTCALTYHLDLKVPCMPLDITGTGTAEIVFDAPAVVNGRAAPTLKLELTRREETCALTYHMDLKVPCMPLELSGEVTATIRKNDPNLTFGMEFKRRDNTCALTYHLDLKVPCMPLEIAGTAEVTIVREQQPTLKLEMTKRQDTCALTYNMDLKIPCMPLTLIVTKTAIIKGTPEHPVTFFVEITKPDYTCGLQHKFDLRIPCLPLRVTSTFQGTVLMNIEKPTLMMPPKLLTRLETPTCKLEMKMNLAIPCLPKQMHMRNKKAQLAGIFSPQLEFRMTRRPDDCVFDVDFVLDMPHIPFGIVVAECPEFLPYGQETACISVTPINGNKALEFKVHLMALFKTECITLVEGVEYESPYLRVHKKKCCFTHGRLLTCYELGTENIIRMQEC